MSTYRAEKLDHAKRMIRRGDLSNNQIRQALTAVFGSAISPSELKLLKDEVRGEPRAVEPGKPVILNADGTWQYLRFAGKDPAT